MNVHSSPVSPLRPVYPDTCPGRAPSSSLLPVPSPTTQAPAPLFPPHATRVPSSREVLPDSCSGPGSDPAAPGGREGPELPGLQTLAPLGTVTSQSKVLRALEIPRDCCLVLLLISSYFPSSKTWGIDHRYYTKMMKTWQ